MVAIDRYRYGCNVHADRGPTVCPNPLKVKRHTVEQRLLDQIRDEVLTDQALSELQITATRFWESSTARRVAPLPHFADGTPHLERKLDVCWTSSWIWGGTVLP